MKNSPFSGKKVEVLLLKPLVGKGNAGEVINVKTHYAMYVLIPNGIAVVYDKQTQNQRNAQMKKIDANKAELQSQVKKFISTVADDGGIKFEKSATEANRLYDSINTKSLVNYVLMKYKLPVSTSNFSLEEKIEELGEYTTRFTFEDMEAEIAIIVTKKEG